MTAIERQQIRILVSDLRPLDHVSIETKRMNFIYGQGVIIHNDYYAVEVYIPRDSKEDMTFFAVERHNGSTHKLGEYYRRIPVLAYSHPKVTSKMKKQFDEAIFQNMTVPENIHAMPQAGDLRQVA